MTDAEQQVEEEEVLLSIYDGDPAFKQISPTIYQYKYGEDGVSKSFLLEISWGPTYPTEKPNVNMDTFYNKHLLGIVRNAIIAHVDSEAEQCLGMPMTYTIFEAVKEKQEELLKEQPESFLAVTAAMERVVIGASCGQEVDVKPKEKKEILSKAQKRKQWDRSDAKGQRARGWDWVDVVKHLSQTGHKDPSGT